MKLILAGDEGLLPLVSNLVGSMVVVRHTTLNRRFQMPRFQIVKVTEGIKTHVKGIHVADCERGEWSVSDLIGIATATLVERAMEDNTPVHGINLNDRIYFLVANDGSVETGDTVQQARLRLGRITNSKVKVCYHAHPDSYVNGFGLINYPSGAEPVKVKIKTRGGIWIDAN